MDTTQIDTVLRRFGLSKYIGVFVCDKLPKNINGACVVNLDKSYERGSHWIVIWVNDGIGEYFDTFGRRPTAILENYMNKNCASWSYNDKQIQSAASKYCGQYCVLFTIFRCRGTDMRAFVNMFTKDTGLNDAIVFKIVRR